MVSFSATSCRLYFIVALVQSRTVSIRLLLDEKELQRSDDWPAGGPPCLFMSVRVGASTPGAQFDVLNH